jgi:hypothetical protein
MGETFSTMTAAFLEVLIVVKQCIQNERAAREGITTVVMSKH